MIRTFNRLYKNTKYDDALQQSCLQVSNLERQPGVFYEPNDPIMIKFHKQIQSHIKFDGFENYPQNQREYLKNNINKIKLLIEQNPEFLLYYWNSGSVQAPANNLDKDIKYSEINDVNNDTVFKWHQFQSLNKPCLPIRRLYTTIQKRLLLYLDINLPTRTQKFFRAWGSIKSPEDSRIFFSKYMTLDRMNREYSKLVQRVYLNGSLIIDPFNQKILDMYNFMQLYRLFMSFRKLMSSKSQTYPEKINISDHNLVSQISDQEFETIYELFVSDKNISIIQESETLKFEFPISQTNQDEYIHIMPNLLYHYDIQGITDSQILIEMVRFQNFQTGCPYIYYKYSPYIYHLSKIEDYISSVKFVCCYQDNSDDLVNRYFADHKHFNNDQEIPSCNSVLVYFKDDPDNKDCPYQLQQYSILHNHTFNMYGQTDTNEDREWQKLLKFQINKRRIQKRRYHIVTSRIRKGNSVAGDCIFQKGDHQLSTHSSKTSFQTYK